MFTTQQEVDEFIDKLYVKILSAKKKGKINFDDCIDMISIHCHMSWENCWEEIGKIYKQFPNSYNILGNFAFAYLEELIRSTTTEYGIQKRFDSPTANERRKIGGQLIELAQKENNKNSNLVALLEEMKHYFDRSCFLEQKDTRNSIAHGYSHASFFDKNAFENLVFDIARLAKHSG